MFSGSSFSPFGPANQVIPGSVTFPSFPRFVNEVAKVASPATAGLLRVSERRSRRLNDLCRQRAGSPPVYRRHVHARWTRRPSQDVPHRRRFPPPSPRRRDTAPGQGGSDLAKGLRARGLGFANHRHGGERIGVGLGLQAGIGDGAVLGQAGIA